MAVSVNRGLDPLTSPREIPRARWAELVAARKYHCLGNIPADCRTLLRIVADAEECDWLGYGSREKYMRDGLDLDPVAVDLAIGFLRAAELEVPIEFSAAVEEGRKLAAHGGDRRSERANQGDNHNLDSRGTSAAYTIARLERDRPDLAAMVKAGELSANAAGVEAGFRKKSTPLDRLRSAWRSASANERAEFLGEVGR